MPKSIHLICGHDERAQPKNVTFERETRSFWSGNWDLSRDEAAMLIGGWLYLHVTKAEPSYYGGPILDFAEASVTDAARTRRIKLRFQPSAEAKQRRWRGMDHGRAWTSGLVDEPEA